MFVLMVIVTSIYFYITALMFLQTYIHHSKSYYLRLAEIVPISRSSVRDETSFYMKIMVNYLQISSLLLNIPTDFFDSLKSATTVTG